MEKILRSIYFNPKSEGAFGGVNRLYYEAKKVDPKLKLSDVENFLKKIDSYTLYRDKRINFPRNKYLIKGIDDLWMSDLGDFSNLAVHNRGYKYVLFTIDSFSKFLWVEPVKKKDSKTVLAAIKLTLERAKPRKPDNWLTDKGGEFTSAITKKIYDG